MMMCAENHPDEFPRPNEKLLKIVAYLAWLLYCPEEKKKAPVSPTKETTDANQ